MIGVELDCLGFISYPGKILYGASARPIRQQPIGSASVASPFKRLMGQRGIHESSRLVERPESQHSSHGFLDDVYRPPGRLPCVRPAGLRPSVAEIPIAFWGEDRVLVGLRVEVS